MKKYPLAWQGQTNSSCPCCHHNQFGHRDVLWSETHPQCFPEQTS
jgi:hypothetical protein